MKKANRSPVTRSRKLVGLITRVSLDEQARNPEGSLVNQLQRSRSHLQYKMDVAREEWTEAGHVELRGISGKDSVRSQEFERLDNDVRAGKIDVVVVTALDRVSRSVKDFLIFFEFLTEHGVEFVSLREGFDTTSPQGKLQATILMALAEFERALTAQRTSEAMADRAERGLWNGGQLLGYDPDLERPGYLKPNLAESRLINHAHDTYLQLGSIKGTVDTVNRQGYLIQGRSSASARCNIC